MKIVPHVWKVPCFWSGVEENYRGTSLVPVFRIWLVWFDSPHFTDTTPGRSQ